MNQDRRNLVAESVIAIAVLVAAWFVLAQPLLARAERAAAHVRSLRAELENYKATVELPPDQARAYLARVDRLTSLASPRSALVEHERILDLAKECGLNLERITPTPDATPSRIGPIIAGARRFHVETEGTFAGLSSFLSALCTRAPMTVVDQFSISAPDRSDPEHLSLSAGVKVGQISTQRLGVAEVEP